MKSKSKALEATIDIYIDKFRPLGGVMPIGANLHLAHVSVSGVFEILGDRLIIRRKRGRPHPPVKLVFRVLHTLAPPHERHAHSGLVGIAADQRYLFVGIAFSDSSGRMLGQKEFPQILIESVDEALRIVPPAKIPGAPGKRVAPVAAAVSRQLTVVSASRPDRDWINFEYVILVQDVATGGIGIIDPGIENESV